MSLHGLISIVKNKKKWIQCIHLFQVRFPSTPILVLVNKTQTIQMYLDRIQNSRYPIDVRLITWIQESEQCIIRWWSLPSLWSIIPSRFIIEVNIPLLEFDYDSLLNEFKTKKINISKLRHYDVINPRCLEHLKPQDFLFSLWNRETCMKTYRQINKPTLLSQDRFIELIQHNSARLCFDTKLIHLFSCLIEHKESRKETKQHYYILNSHSYLNQTAGDTIMISNLINKIQSDDPFVTILLVSQHNIGHNFTRNLEYTKRVVLHQNQSNVVHTIDTLHNRYQHHIQHVFIRNHNILYHIKDKAWLSKTIIYALDPHMKGVALLHQRCYSIWTQSTTLQQKLVQHDVPESKIRIIKPIVYRYRFQETKQRQPDTIRLIYCGTLRDEENIIELCEWYTETIKQNYPVLIQLSIIFGKINGNQSFYQKINTIIKQNKINFLYNISHRESCRHMYHSDIGVCWRKKGWGDNGEISTKMREYKEYGLLVLTQPPTYQDIVSLWTKSNTL